MRKNSLAAIPGRRIRRQYFNIPMYYILFFGLLFTVFAVIEGSLSQRAGAAEWFGRLWSFLLACLVPFIPLSICNRFLFGRIVAVADEQGLHTEKGFFPWESLVRAAYAPTLPSKHTLANYNGIMLHTVRTEANRRRKKLLFIPKLPVHAMWIIRRHAPGVQLRVASEGWVILGLTMGITILLAVLARFGLF